MYTEREREREKGLSTKVFRIEEENIENCDYAKTATIVVHLTLEYHHNHSNTLKKCQI